MNLHELCESLRNGKKWYIFFDKYSASPMDDLLHFTGSQEAVSTCRTGLFAEVSMPVTDNVPNGNHWELYREISFRVIGSEPFRLTDYIDDSNNELHNITADDLITIGKCVAKVRRLCINS